MHIATGERPREECTDLHDQRTHLAHTGIRRRGGKGELKIQDESLEGEGKERE